MAKPVIQFSLFEEYFDSLEQFTFQPFEEKWKANLHWLSSQAALATEYKQSSMNSGQDSIRHHVAALSLCDRTQTPNAQSTSISSLSSGNFSLFSTILPVHTTPLNLPTFVPSTNSLFATMGIDSLLPPIPE